jgi:hypothetical protein
MAMTMNDAIREWLGPGEIWTIPKGSIIMDNTPSPPVCCQYCRRLHIDMVCPGCGATGGERWTTHEK